MSQKSPKMSSDEIEQDISDSKQNGENGDVKIISKEISDGQNEITNGKENNTERQTRRSKRTRSRSTTPLIVNNNGVEKVEDSTNNKEKLLIVNEGTKTEQDKEESENIVKEVTVDKNGADDNQQTEETQETEETVSVTEEKSVGEDLNTTDENMDSEFMDPLVLQSDEPCSELEFEENSDRESGKYSPALSRCLTRRSQNRNIPTPKTPKSLFDEPEPEKETPSTPDPEAPKISLSKDFNETDDNSSNNTDNLSTKVQVGGDTIGRSIDFSDSESDFLLNLKNRRENDQNYARRSLSSRRSIRQAPSSGDDNNIRKKMMKNSLMHRANLSIPLFFSSSSSTSRDSVERAPSVKRKSRSETPEDGKRFKMDDSNDVSDGGIFAKIASPFVGLRNRFAGSPPNGTSTPKLTSFRDGANHFGGDFYDRMERSAPLEGAVDEETPQNANKWCAIM